MMIGVVVALVTFVGSTSLAAESGNSVYESLADSGSHTESFRPLEMCVQTPTYKRGNAYMRYLYEMFDKQDYPYKKLLVMHNGYHTDKSENLAARQFWQKRVAKDPRVYYEEVVTAEVASKEEVEHAIETGEVVFVTSFSRGIDYDSKKHENVWTLGRKRNVLVEISLRCEWGRGCQPLNSDEKGPELDWFDKFPGAKQSDTRGCDVLVNFDDDDYYDDGYLSAVATRYEANPTLKLTQVENFQEYCSAPAQNGENRQDDSTVYFYERKNYHHAPYRGYAWSWTVHRRVFEPLADEGLALRYFERSYGEEHGVYETLAPYLDMNKETEGELDFSFVQSHLALHLEVGRGTAMQMRKLNSSWTPHLRDEVTLDARTREAAGAKLYVGAAEVRQRVAREIYPRSKIFHEVFCRFYGYEDIRKVLCSAESGDSQPVEEVTEEAVSDLSDKPTNHEPPQLVQRATQRVVRPTPVGGEGLARSRLYNLPRARTSLASTAVTMDSGVLQPNGV